MLQLAQLVGFEIEVQKEIKEARYTADEEGKAPSLPIQFLAFRWAC